MFTLESFYDLISRNAQVTLVNTRYHKNVYTGSVRNIPVEYSDCPVEDFSMNDKANCISSTSDPSKKLAARAKRSFSSRPTSSTSPAWASTAS